MSDKFRGFEGERQSSIAISETIPAWINRDAFRQDMQSQGVGIEERLAVNERHEILRLPPGRYAFQVGFRPFDDQDRRRFYGNNPVEQQQQPISLDMASTEYVSLERSFRNALQVAGVDLKKIGELEQLKTLIDVLDQEIAHHLHSDERTENVRNLSDILRNGHTACAGKTLVAGLLAERLHVGTGKNYQAYSVQEINGSSSPVIDKRSNDIGHAWLRISDGKNVALYDPHYGKKSFYTFGNVTPRINDPFKSYGVEGGALAATFSSLHADQLLVTGPRDRTALVTSIHGTKELWLDPTHAFLAQLQGHMDLAVRTQRGGTIDLVNGCIERTRDPDDAHSGRLLNPLLSLTRMS